MTHSYSFYFGEPAWLLALILIVPIVWIALRYLPVLGRTRRILAIAMRILLISILVLLLASPQLIRTSRRLTVIAVIDRSQSIPIDLGEAVLKYMDAAVGPSSQTNLLAVVDVAEAASISKLPSSERQIRRRNTTLTGDQTRLAAGIEMAMAIAPPDSATRIVLVSEGNETEGDLKAAARSAAANGIPIDVLPIYYKYENEVIFRKLSAPAKAASGQTISLRFVLESTTHATGRLLLNLNGKAVDLAPDSDETAVPVVIEPGTNVKTVSVPVGTRGLHDFEAVFIPDDPAQDRITANNTAGAMTYVAGPGHVLVVSADNSIVEPLQRAIQAADIDTRYLPVSAFPDTLAKLLDTDAVVLVDTDCSSFTYQQQQMLVRYVNDLGGGLVMVGGPHSFGAGGWIGSPIAQILPVDLDPPQKKQLPKGALVLIMHSCEMPQGNYWGKEVAIAAVQALSRLDLVGILAYNWQGTGDWVHPLSEVGDKNAVVTAIQKMQMGDMPDLGGHLQAAYDKLSACDAGQKHVIVISDGDPAPPSQALLDKLKAAGITCSGVAVFPHSPQDTDKLLAVAQATGGRFYDVKDPESLPRIFIKEAQTVRRSLIVEETFTPAVVCSLSDLIKGVQAPLPNLDGYVLTGPRGGLNQLVLAGRESDPILASCQSGLGRCVAFTSAVDSRWAAAWLSWPGFARFWEQTIRWAGRPSQTAGIDVSSETTGRQVTVNVEATDTQGKSAQFGAVDAWMIGPDMTGKPLSLTQTGPGQYQGRFEAAGSGNYVITLRQRKEDSPAGTLLGQHVVTVPFAPEFRDLADNAPLMYAVSEITGGRVLPMDPNQADLYNYAGLKFPRSHQPLTRLLCILWIAVLLADVATRRLALDFAAAGRRIYGLVRRSKVRKEDQTLTRLQQTRDQLHQQWARRTTEPWASRRYTAGEQRPGTSALPTPESELGKPLMPETPKPPPKPPQAEPERPHIDRLIRAKKRAIDETKKRQDQTE